MISFGMPDEIRERVDLVRGVARELMRPAARPFDEREHEIPWDFVNAMWDLALKTGASPEVPERDIAAILSLLS